ncbi:hypothetical protein OG21DRAFT_1528029, partial [Imleria badia]
MAISEALESFELPDLHNAILGCLDHCSNGEPHAVEGRRPVTSRPIHPTEKLEIWTKIRVQLWTWCKPESVELAQTLVIAPPSQCYPSGCYNCVIISPTVNSDWPSGGLNRHLVIQLRLVFRVPGVNNFFAYMQHFNLAPTTDPTS